MNNLPYINGTKLFNSPRLHHIKINNLQRISDLSALEKCLSVPRFGVWRRVPGFQRG
jgi:hypothetical protein